MTTSTAVHSNAFNFMSFLQGGVDPRTGLYTVAITLPEIKSNDLAGPVLPLALTYNPLNTLDSGFGLGWTLQLSQFTLINQVLSLHTGETFKKTGNGSGDLLVMKEKKLDSFHFHELSGTRYKVVHKSGLVEILNIVGPLANRVALPHEIYSANGRMITLSYTTFLNSPLLETVSDDQRVLLRVTRTAREVELLFYPDDAEAARFVLTLIDADYKVEKLQLPTDNQAGWYFRYRKINDLTCITEVRTPTGGEEIIEYNDGGHAFPGLTSRPNLPRVTDHRINPGTDQSVITVKYAYSGNDSNNLHNFLGYNASGLIWEDNDLDNLYKVRRAYLYGTTESLMVGGQAVRTIERSFNRFHLLVEEKTTQNGHIRSVVTAYHAQDNIDFDDQLDNFQLPRTVTTTWEVRNSGRIRQEVLSTCYDEHGNLTERIQPNGIKQTSIYYPLSGETGHCPADPENFVRQLKQTTVTPATSEHGDPAPVLCTRYRYKTLTALANNQNPWVVPLDETLLQVEGASERTLQVNTFTYHEQLTDRVQYGRPKRESVTLNGLCTHTDYAYARLASQRVGETVLQTTQTLSTSFDAVRKVIIEESSLLNGQALLSRDDNDVEIRITYDALGRVLSETVAPGDPDYEATRYYSYFLIPQPQSAGTRQKAAQLLTDVKQVQTRTEFDGLNRPVYEERQDVDNPDSSGAFRQTYEAEYDLRGQLIRETEYDWLDWEDYDDLILTTTFGYDDWGQQRSETGPDGVVTITEDDPIGRRMPDDSFLPTLSRWQQTSAIANLKYGYSVTQLNLFAKPDKIIRLTANGQEISELAYFYDGLGRTVDAIDALGHHTLYRYDAFDRMFESTLPGGDRIIRTYAAHSSAELPETLDIQPLNQVLPRVRTGEQLFDGLGRLTQLKVGPRMERFLYKGSQSQASDRLTAKGNTIHYEYAPNLVESPISSMAPDEQTSFDYDHRSARLTASTNSLGRREYVYDGTHQLKTERWIANNKTWTTTYVNSLQGRQLHRLEVSGIATRSVHDKAGRLRQVTQGNLQSHFYYDTLGRPNRTVSEDRYTGKQLESHLTYDDQGRETLRTISLSGHPTRTISQDWQNDDQLQCRHLQMDGQSLLREDFTYDPRGRLVQHDYSGTNLPTDSYGRPIVRQQFRFDVLDNITRRLTTFADTSTDVASFIYDAVGAPFLLTGVTHTNPPASVTFDYDDDGNMLNDQDNRRLFYDSQGRLLKSEDPSGTGKSEYRYDGHNHLVSDTQGTSPETLHFYQGSRLSNTVQGDIKIQYLYGQNHPLGQQQSGDNSKTLLLMTNASQSVIGESQQDTLHSAVYNAYGESSGDTLQSRLAFNGEARDLGTDWYLLGNGYRVYNPGLMRFHSPDSLSPFGSGGLNPYVYCLGNPIAFNDPTGHSVGLVDWRAQSDKRHDIQKAVLIASVSLLLSAGGTVTTLNAFAATAIAIEATSGALNIIDAINGNEDNQKTADALMWAGLVIGLVGGFGGGTKKSILPNDNWTFKQNPLYGSMKSPAQKHWLGRARNANWHLHFNNDDMPIFKSRPSIEDRLIGPLPVEVQGPDAARTIAYSAAFPSDFSTKADTFILDTGRAQVPQVLYISIVKSPPPPPTIVKLPPSPPTPTPTKKWPDVTINPGVRLTNNRELVNYGAAIRKI